MQWRCIHHSSVIECQVTSSMHLTPSDESYDGCAEFSHTSNTDAACIARINRALPVEAILRIFHEVSQQTDTSHSDLPSYHWISLTHVCRYWRNMALQDPTLWQCIETTQLDCVEAFIARSGSLPLFVTCFEHAAHRRTSRRDAINTIQMLLPEFNRVATLTLSDRLLCAYFVTESISRGMPILQHLTLNSEDTWLWDSNGLEEYVLPERTPPQEKFPSLESLRCTFLPAGSFRAALVASCRLRRLEVVRPERLSSADEWTGLLMAFPLLKILSLCTAVSTGSDSGGRPIHLPHLEKLYITATNTTTGEYALLERLVIPPSTAVYVQVVLCDRTDTLESSRRLLHAVKTCLTSTGERSPPQRLELSLNGYAISAVACRTEQDTKLCVKDSTHSSYCYPRSHISEDHLAPGFFYISMKQHLTGEGSLMFDMRDMLTSLYSFSEVQYLRLVTDELAVVRDPAQNLLSFCFSEMFAAMNDLSTFIIDSTDYMYAITLACAGDNPRGAQVFFPNLKRLGIRYSRVNSRTVGHEDGAPDPRIERLASLLRLRDGTAHGLEQVHICEVRDLSGLQMLKLRALPKSENCTSQSVVDTVSFTS